MTLKDHEINEKSAQSQTQEQQTILDLQKQLKDTQEQLDKKINETAAVINMKKML